jgi:hypothetical protein
MTRLCLNLVTFYLATRKDGSVILHEKHHHNGVLLKDVTSFALCQVGVFGGRSEGGKKSCARDLGKPKGVHFKPKQQYDTMASTDCVTKADEASFSVRR